MVRFCLLFTKTKYSQYLFVTRLSGKPKQRPRLESQNQCRGCGQFQTTKRGERIRLLGLGLGLVF